MIAILALLFGIADDAAVRTISVVPDGDLTAVVIGVDGPVTVRDFTLENPHRLVIDLSGAEHALPAERFMDIGRGGVLAVRTSQYQASVVRIVLELAAPVRYLVRESRGEVRIEFENPGGRFVAWSAGDPPVGVPAGGDDGGALAGMPALQPATASALEARPAVRRPSDERTSSAPVAAVARPIVQPTQQQDEPRITVSFDDAPILDVIQTFAAFSGRSIIPGSGVTGSITADIYDQPWDEALEALLEAYGYTLLERPNGILQVVQLSQLRERETVENLATRNFRIRYIGVDSIAPAIEGLLSERGSVTTSPSTNTLIVTDVESVLNRIDPLIQQLDARTPQVTIAAKIIFVDRTALEELGVVYDLKDSQGSQFNQVVSGFVDSDGDGVLEPDEETDEDVIALGGTSIAALANARTRVASPALQIVTTLLLGRHSLITFIDALESLQLSDIQAAPVVTVLDNRQARIQVGEETPVRIIEAGAGGTGGGSFPQATVTFRETGVILEVTPHVTGNQVLLDLHAERSNIAAAPSDLGITFQTQESDTQVLVNDGETVVIGGLTIIEKSQSRSGIPFLMDLPVLGKLFATTQEREVKRDLMIMVTPHIVREGT